MCWYAVRSFILSDIRQFTESSGSEFSILTYFTFIQFALLKCMSFTIIIAANAFKVNISKKRRESEKCEKVKIVL